ncbi:MAG: type IV secretory system conjugative DNA transfer family protein [Clostridium sp.]|nr:type IV secretory system conjugative DNA transfer family protein [Clostridium sp.]
MKNRDTIIDATVNTAFSPRMLGREVLVSNNTWETRLNNNDLIVGATGSGKTRGYVIPNIRQHNGSMIVTDTKGNLHKLLRRELEADGYEVRVLDFVNPKKSCAYNPLDYIETDKKTGRYREQDIITLARTMVPIRCNRDPYWEESAGMILASLIAFVKEVLPVKEQNMPSVLKLSRMFHNKWIVKNLFASLQQENPDSFAVRKYKDYCTVMNDADKTWASIMQFLVNSLDSYDFAEVSRIFGKKAGFHFRDLGERKMALFVNISDTDRAFDRLANVFYTQAIQQLCKEADSRPDGRLKVPVRMILDDFASSAYIPDFDKIISVIRSREISVSLILQSLSQLETMYTPAQAKTIINGCDHLLYLGGQDVDTAGYIGTKANQPIGNILNMGLDDAYLFARGTVPRKVDKINPSENEAGYDE